MKCKAQVGLYAAAMLCIALALGSCGERASEQAAVRVTPTRPPEYIVFNDENISLSDYASLISLYGQLSYENVSVEDRDDFAAAAERYDLEQLYDLYDFIASLPEAEANELHRIMLEALNNT